jgi:F-type H+-transporting ATPase subunit delta
MRGSAEARVVANRYAKALLRVVLDKKDDPEQIDRELLEMAELFKSHPDLERTLASPVLVSSRRVAVVDELVACSRLSRTAANLLRVMAAKERLSLLELIRESYRRGVDEHLEIETAEVTTAQALNKKQEEKLIEGLGAMTGKTVRAHFRSDSEVLGGLVVRIGNRIYDASVASQLERFRERLLSTY